MIGNQLVSGLGITAHGAAVPERPERCPAHPLAELGAVVVADLVVNDSIFLQVTNDHADHHPLLLDLSD